MEKPITPKSSVIQMAFLGVVAITVGVVCLLVVTLIYHLPPLTSISESATTGNRAGMIVPFAQGCMFTYCIAYVGYCHSERVLTRVMAVGFAISAMQLCDSPYLDFDRVGLLGLPIFWSDLVHFIGSIIGFGCMFIWIAFFFTRGVPKPTPEKLRRNQVYFACAVFMAAGILLFVMGLFNTHDPYRVFIAEQFMLIPAGIALLVKSGVMLKDKKGAA